MNKRAQQFIQGFLIVLVVFLAYLPALRGGFIWDDDAYVTKNTTLHNLDGLWQIWFQVGAVPQYYPLVYTSFWLEYHLWNLNPLGYHLVNVLLHAIAAILLWRVLLRLQIPGAWLAAVIFAIHPVYVESVAWITERKNVLSIVFYFAAALSYLRFVASGDASVPERRRWHCYWGALILFMAALLSKTVTCSLPAALLLVFWWKKGRLRQGDILPLLPFFLIGMALGLVTIWVEKHCVGAQGTEWSLTFGERCLIAGRSLWFYAGKLVWPVQLTFIYPRWKIETEVWWQWLFPIAAVCVVAGLWLARRRIGKGPLTAVLFFMGTLVPALGFVNVFPMRYSFVADHFQYLASVGLIVLCAAGLYRIPRIVPATVVVVLGVLTWRQAGVYRNLETLWRDTLAKNPECWMAQGNLGALLLHKEGCVGEAVEHFRKAIQINPNLADACFCLGTALGLQKRFDEAFESYNRSIQIDPNNAEAYYWSGIALDQLGRTKEAVTQYREALKLNPELAGAMNNLAWALAASSDDELRNGAEAVRLGEHACELTHYSDPLFLGTLAAAYAECGRFSDAITTAEKAESLAGTAGLKDLAEKNRQLLELYRAGKPYRELPPSKP
jgi:Tfp pilus assembly protein PilF